MTKESMIALLECPVCFETFDEQCCRTPATLLCGHTMCLEHYEREIATTTAPGSLARRCPICRLDVTATPPTRNVLVCEIIAELSGSKEVNNVDRPDAEGAASMVSSIEDEDDGLTRTKETPRAVVRLQQRLKEAENLMREKARVQANDSKLILQLSKKMEDLLLDNSELRNARDALNKRLHDALREREPVQRQEPQRQSLTKSPTSGGNWCVEAAVIAVIVLFLFWGYHGMPNDYTAAVPPTVPNMPPLSLEA